MKRFLIFILIFLAGRLWSAEIQGELKSAQENIKMGDVINATLEVWPARVENVERINEYVGNRFLDHFYLSKILKISPSMNNQDYIIAEVLLVPLSNPKAFSILRLGDENVNVKMEFSVEEIKIDENKPVNVWQASINQSQWPFIVGIVSFILISVGLFLRFKPQGKKEIKIQTLNWGDLKEREDFERKYFELKRKIDPIENLEVDKFKKIIEEILYIKDWKEDDVKLLKDISEKVNNGVH